MLSHMTAKFLSVKTKKKRPFLLFSVENALLRGNEEINIVSVLHLPVNYEAKNINVAKNINLTIRCLNVDMTLKYSFWPIR